MNIYRLDQIKHNDSSLELSTVKECILVGAESANAARDLAALNTMQCKTISPGYSPKRRSPWLDDAVTRCVWDTSRTDLQMGDAVTSAGQRLPCSL
jgi:hypothetical protein